MIVQNKHSVHWQFCFMALMCIAGYTTCHEQYSSKVFTLKSNKKTFTGENANVLNDQLSSFQRRTKRNPPTSEEIRLYVNKHNEVRRLEGSSNMHILKWNSALAEMAQLWAENCAWMHGQPSYNNPPFDPIGQNLYITTQDVLDIDYGIQGWYDEKAWYHPSDQSCDSGKLCGHYTQVVWDVTEELGCAVAFCASPTGLSSSFRNSQYLVCNYGPAGNYPRAPYSVGKACTECSSGRFWCDDGLCRSDCTGQSSNCECRADCKNCALTNRSACTCECMPGWTGNTCSKKCGNYHEWCGNGNGWPTSWCTQQYSYVLENCPLHCGLCEPADPSMEECDDSTSAGSRVTTNISTEVVILQLLCLPQIVRVFKGAL